MDLIYLDSNATTPVLPEVWEAMRPYAVETFGNPASAHRAGQRARRALEDAREEVASLLGAAPDEVVFTSGATEANNLGLAGLAGNRPGHILASSVEHPSVAEAARNLAGAGWAVEWLPVDAAGLVAAMEMKQRLRPDTQIVTVQLANHETGVVQPIAELAHAVGTAVAFHCDAVQAVGKLAVDFHALGVTTLSASAHKFHGPKGIGVLLVRRSTKLRPSFHGGHQQQGRRPGTEPVALAVGLAAALRMACQDMAQRHLRVLQLRRRFLHPLQRACMPVMVNPDAEGPIPHTLNLSFPGCRADVLLMNLDLAGIACSTGSACSSGSLLPSPVLQAMGVPAEILASAMRFSLNFLLADHEIDEAARLIGNVVRRLRETAME